MTKKQIILFNGSPRRKGTSYSFARTIRKLAEEQGNTAVILDIADYFQEDGSEDLRYILMKSDVIGLISPLYVDTLPYPVILFLEKLAAEYQGELRGKTFFAIGQNGFPDVTLMQPMLGSCRCFAQKTGMKWLGGLAYAGGAIINGTLLEDLGKKGETITAGFKIALEDILQGRPLRPEAQERLTLKLPKILYWPLAFYLNHNARNMAKQAGVKDLRIKVYLDR
jgi:multimeric flavodoxin WrbA